MFMIVNKKLNLGNLLGPRETNTRGKFILTENIKICT